MYRFLLSPKWLLGHVLVLTVLVTFPQLGVWQLNQQDRLEERNAAIEAQLAAPPQPLGDALAGGTVAYERVVAEGTYRQEDQVLSAPASRDERPPGHQVLTPLDTDAGTLLVDRGWVPFDRDGVDDQLLATPDGTVRVEGLLMPPEPGDPGDGEFVGAIDPAHVAARTGVDLLPNHLLLRDADPAPDGPLPSGEPSAESGNHLSYAAQWFLFTAVVAIGYPILLVRTARDRRRDADLPPDARDAPEVSAGV